MLKCQIIHVNNLYYYASNSSVHAHAHANIQYRYIKDHRFIIISK